jgi:hypothetical protein
MQTWHFLKAIAPFLVSRHRPGPNTPQWRKAFSLRQTTIYHAQDNHLRVLLEGLVVEDFLNSSNPDLSPHPAISPWGDLSSRPVPDHFRKP